MLTLEQVQDLKQKMYLPKVVTDKSITALIGSANGISYSLYTLLPGSTSWIFYTSNDNDDVYKEQYTILSGKLEVERGGKKIVMHPGDVIDTKMNRTVHTCYANETVEMLLEMTSSLFEKSFAERCLIQRDARKIQEVDGYTYHHCSRISNYSIELWKRMKPTQNVSILSIGAYFHDIGKLAIPLEILNKSGKLTEDEWNIIKMHTTLGAEMMRNHEVERLREAAFIVEEHHERYDGKGYPYGLLGSQISLEASIVSVVDAFDAMTTNRVYRGAMTIEEAIQEMKDGKGTQFNPLVIDEFLKMLEEKNNKWT
ncbi:HD domain-containing phosphohydrolase [Psychrobacillus soli]|uniref:HD-GYP domain-containing protein n=1 Tax=Psychrobacillus soli TaxID=1543965 RepID=A0A544SRY9_9BACI|nr:HD domain-containing phosphohydrolase [Psychrobacillus soli]TQR07976.1 HD-GYP domain-containing protein [Psychrobacillus soli]